MQQKSPTIVNTLLKVFARQSSAKVSFSDVINNIYRIIKQTTLQKSEQWVRIQFIEGKNQWIISMTCLQLNVNARKYVLKQIYNPYMDLNSGKCNDFEVLLMLQT